MKILGINSGLSLPNSYPGAYGSHYLNDGSASLLINGQVNFAAIEERHTRSRYAGGFKSSLKYWQEQTGMNPLEVDAIAFSSCCGPKWTEERDVIEFLKSEFAGSGLISKIKTPRVVIVDHHDSHAALGFMLSGFDRALVSTIDGFGNIINSDGWDPKEWWNGSFERNSYYVAERKGRYFVLNKIAGDATDKDEIGIGELYSYLTHFCGWHSYQHCGTVMALSAFGDSASYPGVKFIRSVNEHLKVLLPNNHPCSAETFQKFLIANNIALKAMSSKTVEPEDKEYCNLISKVQKELESAITSKLTGLAEKYNLENIVVTGGVALNCLAIGALASAFKGNVFVPPAPSDTGQSLGNAIWAAYCDTSPVHEDSQFHLNNANAPFWGIPCSAQQVKSALELLSHDKSITIKEITSISDGFDYAARALSEGALVATCIGRAEYGPRALGGRSVLADPRKTDMAQKVNSFKKREIFRPYAPSILFEYVEEYFTVPVNSPYMSFAVPLTDIAKQRIPAVVHADGTARVQTVEQESSSPLRPILESFNELTGVPVLINTSFNRKGEPIVETPIDAVNTFLDSTLDVLLLDNYIITRRKDLK